MEFTITERTEPFTLEEVFEFIDDTNISKMDAHELKSRIANMLQAEKDKAIKNAEEQGLLLPVAIGTEVWKIHRHSGGGRVADWFETFPCKFDYNLIPMFGKTVFLTKEKAEQALKRIEQENRTPIITNSAAIEEERDV